jgi:hypothetical protein
MPIEQAHRKDEHSAAPSFGSCHPQLDQRAFMISGRRRFVIGIGKALRFETRRGCLVKPMRARGGIAAELCGRRRQKRRCQPPRLNAIEINISESAGSRPQHHSDVAASWEGAA